MAKDKLELKSRKSLVSNQAATCLFKYCMTSLPVAEGGSTVQGNG